MRSQAAVVASALALTGHADAFWRMPCRSQTGVGRIDPIMDPGEVSDHVHTIHGGGGMGFTADYASLSGSNCTSCEVTQDKSAYWTPTMHFVYSNGTSVMVEQVGGMLAYYLYYLDNVKAFPEGFQMVAGNKNARDFHGPVPDIQLSYWPTDPSDQFFLQQRALGFNCLNYAIDPEPSLYRHTFPNKTQLDNDCVDGLRLELAFPSCGNGSLDSADHKSHMKYPSLVKEGNCPSGYDHHYPFLFYETIWNTYAFAGEDGQFVLSNGDPTGCGYHGDFIMGWESSDFLQSALDTCQNPSGEISDCPLFKTQQDDVAAQCTFDTPSALKDDDVFGPRDGLPVNVPIQYGPDNATAYPVAGRSGEATSALPTTSVSKYAPLPTFSYTAANPSITSTAQLGIVVNKVTSLTSSSAESASSTSEYSAPSSVSSETSSITQAPIYDASSSPEADIIATSYTTSGNAVVEWVIEEVNVTVTATPSAAAKHRRHLHKHLHHAGRF